MDFCTPRVSLVNFEILHCQLIVGTWNTLSRINFLFLKSVYTEPEVKIRTCASAMQ